MKVFLSSTYIELIEHRIIPAGGKAAHGEYHPRIKPRMHEWESGIREFVKNSWTVHPRITP